jgi:hypothetical protein
MIGSATMTGRADDLIDALLTVTHGEVLAPPAESVRDGRGGEYDHYLTKLTRRDVRRLSAAGLISSHGMPADRLAAHAGSLDNADVFADWYCSQALAGLDARAAARGPASAEREEWGDNDQPETSAPPELPAELTAYLDRLIHEPKAMYAATVALALVDGQPIPPNDARWAPDVVHKVTKYLRPMLNPTQRGSAQ